MAQPKDSLAIEPSGFFALRTPLLPWQELEAWNQGLRAPQAGADPDDLATALEADRMQLRRRLQTLVERPEIREALFVAAPELSIGLEAWQRDPDSKKGRRAEQSLVRYFLRMTARSTPFGLFSGCSVGVIGSETRLRLVDRQSYRRHTRLDTDYLFALTEDLGRDPEIRRRLHYRPNSSLYDTAGRLRYAESRLQGGTRVNHLVAVDNDDYLDSTLTRATDGATLDDLATALVAADPDGDIELDEAEAYIEELIDAQLLISDLSPLVTGRESIHDLLDQLAELPSAQPTVAGLTEACHRLRALDAAGLGLETDAYQAIATRLEELPTKVRRARLFQVDMVKPTAQASLGHKVLEEIERGLAILRRVATTPREDGLHRFCEDFKARYGDGRTELLVEVLDEEVGIGFDGSRSSDVSPLLAGLKLPTSPQEPTVPWGPRTEMLFEKLQQAAAQGAQEVSLSRADLAALGDQEVPLADGFQVMAAIAADSADAVDNGDFEIYMKNAYGPSGVQLLGRFCHADRTLRDLVEDHLRREEALQPEAIFAEIVHLPEGRTGNILARPVLRDHEIPFLGRSGADTDRQIQASDLLVTVSGQEIWLHCARSGRRVIPRLTTAHNFWGRGLAVYRFLGSLQTQGVTPTLQWSWGGFENADFLPRVRSGRLILSRAQWQVRDQEIRRLVKKKDPERFAAVQAWRDERRVPRRVALQDGDNELLVDFDNTLSVETFLAVVKNRSSCALVELFPNPDRLCVDSSEGAFLHELVIPFVRRRPEEPRRVARPPARPGGRRTFLPGSEWLYAKLYTGTATADRLLTQVVRPLVGQMMANGAADGWFFIRYGDPSWHLRLRFHGDPQRLQGEVLPWLHHALAPLAADGWFSALQIDTYERETERYGGAEAMEVSERLFQADSDAVLEILDLLDGDEGAVARWHLALRGIDQLLSDLGFDTDTKLKLLELMQTSWAQEFRVDGGFRKQLSRRLRHERRELEALLSADHSDDHPLMPGFAVLDRRSRRLAPIRDELHALQRAGRLTLPLEDMAMSYVHMFTNRLLRSQGRFHELVLYDFLYRIYQSRAARQRASQKRVPKKAAA